MRLCSTCNACLEGKTEYLGDYGSQNYPTPTPAYAHHRSIGQFVSAVQDGCELCSTLWQEISCCYQDWETSTRSDHSKAAPGGKATVYFRIRANKNDHSNDNTIELLVDPAVLEGLSERRKSFYGASMLGVQILALEFKATNSILKVDAAVQDPHVPTLCQRQQTTSATCSTGCPHALAVLANWMATCDQHDKCSEGLDNHWMPSRLLDIGTRGAKNPTIFRVVAATRETVSAPYIALSHCWGKARFLRLETDNLAALEIGQNIEVLPQTFRDAINVCQVLHIRYLWIDSLCIIQDDLDDWANESQTMCQVYANAWCTIAADLGTSAGLFHSRLPGVGHRLCHDMAPSNALGMPAERYEIAERFAVNYRLEGSPLNKRGWVFQERLLSRRIIHFSESQLLWECHTLTASEAYPKGIPSEFYYSRPTDLSVFRQHYRDRTRQLCHAYLEPCSICQAWGVVVRTFSDTQLTHLDDRPIAILGLAQRIGELLDDRYVVGMWERHIHAQLLWIADDPSRDGIPAVQQTGTVPCRRQFPTFSWLSLDTGITLSEPTSGSWFHFDVLDLHLDPMTVKAEGIRQHGWLKVRCAILHIWLQPEPSNSSGSGWRWDDLRVSTGKGSADVNIPCLFWPDWGRSDLPWASQSDNQHFLMIMTEDHEAESMECLILEVVDPETATFRRVGASTIEAGYGKLLEVMEPSNKTRKSFPSSSKPAMLGNLTKREIFIV